MTNVLIYILSAGLLLLGLRMCLLMILSGLYNSGFQLVLLLEFSGMLWILTAGAQWLSPLTLLLSVLIPYEAVFKAMLS